MTYNLDLLFAAVILCFCMAIHAVATHGDYKGNAPRILYGFIAFSFLDASADICASLLIQHSASYSLAALYAADIVLYLAQACLAYLLFIYVIFLTGFLRKEMCAFAAGSGIFCFVSMALVLTTPLTGLIFSFDPITHAYSYGPLRPILFVESFIYGLSCVVLMAREVHFLRFVDLLSVGVTIVLTFATAAAQAMYPMFAVTGFAAVLGTLLLYMAMLDSHDMTDDQTGLLGQGEFRRRVASLTKRKEYFNVTVLSLSNHRHLGSLLGSDAVSGLFIRMANNLMSISPNGQVYRLEGPTAALITYEEKDAQLIEESTRLWFGRHHAVQGMDVRVDGYVFNILDAVRLSGSVDMETLISYLVDCSEAQGSQVALDEDLLKNFNAYQEANAVLTRAIEEDSFEIAMQPLIEVRCQEDEAGQPQAAVAFASCEVLSRLKGPDGAYISPLLFIDLAEKTGNIHRLTMMQFRRLCVFMEAHAPYFIERNIVDVKFNLSVMDFANENLAGDLLECIEEHRLPYDIFTFEITETVLSLGVESLNRTIGRLRDAGCRIFLDDFGSGYANLEIINRVPLDGVKLDMTLLRDIQSDPKAARFYRGIVDVLHHLGMKVVSEGVSSEEQAKMLISWNVDMLQGFYYARPVLSGDLLAFFDSCEGKTQVGWARWPQ